MSYTLYLGDCLNVLPTLADNSVHAVIADPPYGTTACKWDSVIPLDAMWTQLKRVIKPKGAIVLFGSQPFTSQLVMSNPDWFKYQWVWEKSIATGFNHAANMPLRNYEDVAIFSDGSIQHEHLTDNRMKYYPQGLQRHDVPNRRGSLGLSGTMERKNHSNTYVTRFTNYPRMLLYFPNDGNTVHPTQKPVALLEYLIRTYTNEGETVLDFTMGSGTTGVACLNTGRRFIGIEKEPQYYAIAGKRMAEVKL